MQPGRVRQRARRRGDGNLWTARRPADQAPKPTAHPSPRATAHREAWARRHGRRVQSRHSRSTSVPLVSNSPTMTGTPCAIDGNTIESGTRMKCRSPRAASSGWPSTICRTLAASRMPSTDAPPPSQTPPAAGDSDAGVVCAERTRATASRTCLASATSGGSASFVSSTPPPRSVDLRSPLHAPATTPWSGVPSSSAGIERDGGRRDPNLRDRPSPPPPPHAPLASSLSRSSAPRRRAARTTRTAREATPAPTSATAAATKPAMPRVAPRLSPAAGIALPLGGGRANGGSGVAAGRGGGSGGGAAKRRVRTNSASVAQPQTLSACGAFAT